MTLEKTGMTPEQVQAVRDRPLKDSYEVHDVGHEIIVTRLQAHDFVVEDHGDDARHADEVFYGDGPDLAVYDSSGEELLAYIEIKCKESPEWFGRCNLRHYNEYVNFANEVDVPVFVWFALVDQETGICHRESFIPVKDTDQISGDVVDVSEESVVFRPEDIEVVSESDKDLRVVQASDVIGVQSRDRVTDYIPEVHGNEVIELNDDEFRSWPHFLHTLDA